MIASHYASPVERRLVGAAVLRAAPSADAEPRQELERGTDFWMLDETLGWSWGYAGNDHRVGYVPSGCLGR